MEIPKIVMELPPAPADVASWILKDIVTGRYMIYSNKEDRAVCTYCGKAYKPSNAELIPPPKNNEKVVCPNCHETATYKCKGIGRGKLTEMTRIMLITKKGKSIYITISEIDILFKEEMPEICRWIQAVYKFNNKEQIYYRHSAGWYGTEHWENVKNIKVPGVGCMGYGIPERQGIYLYEKNFNKVFKGTDLKYSDAEEVHEANSLSPEGLLQYILLSSKYQSIEILRKSGFWHLVRGKIDKDGGSRSVNWKAKDLKKILNINRSQMKEVKADKMGLGDLEIYKRQIRKGEPVKIEQIELIRYFFKETEINLYTSIAKASAYIVKQRKAEGEDARSDLRDYLDYLKECEKLGFNLTEKKTMYPKDFAKAHKESSEKVREIKEQLDQEAFTKAQYKLTGMKEPYISDGLMMILAKDQKDLRAEGQSQGHCVGGYGSGIVEGRYAILFIRKVSEPEKSFYTLELSKDKKIEQCRGKSNCGTTEEVQAFIEKWQNEVILGKKTKKRKVA